MAVEVIRAGSPGHFRAAARLHAEGITEGFLSTLGKPFLAALYEGIAAAKEAGVFVALEDGEVLGFISYARDVKGCYRQVLRRKWPGLTRAMLPNLFRGTIYRKVWETLRYPFTHKTQPVSAAKESCTVLRPELLSMAVGPRARGKGVGKLLVLSVDKVMQELGQEGYFVVTHGVDERSNGFYQGCGFRLTGSYESHGKPMNEYYKRLP